MIKWRCDFSIPESSIQLDVADVEVQWEEGVSAHVIVKSPYDGVTTSEWDVELPDIPLSFYEAEVMVAETLGDADALEG